MIDEATRTRVLWVGPTPDESFWRAFSSQKLSLKLVDDLHPDDLIVSRCAIFNVLSNDRAAMYTSLAEMLPSILEHGITAIILTQDTDVSLRIQYDYRDILRYRQTSRIDSLQIRPQMPAIELAEIARDAKPGPGANLELEWATSDDSILSLEDQLLLRRAFYDMKSVFLRPLTDGKSSARVYQANTRKPGAGSIPLPYLVKFDQLDYSRKELDAYKIYVAGSIPFNQRPNFEIGRCLSGYRQGVLVGDFVEGAVSLSKVAARPEGRNVLYSLFDDALRNWRLNAYDRGLVEQSVLDSLPVEVRPNDISSAVQASAAVLGCTLKLDEVIARLQRISVHKFRVGVAHGDLHAGNVMVRLGEAILIDFSFARDSCAIFSDVACLEVGLVFTSAAETIMGSKNSSDATFEGIWKSEVEELYRLDRMLRVPPIFRQECDCSWLRDRVRQLRGMAASCEATLHAYTIAVVAYLIRRARLGNSEPGNVFVAATALVTAEKLIFELEQETL